MLFFPALPAQTLWISYAPDVVFRGDPATFRLRGEGGPSPLAVHSNGVQIASIPLAADPVEFTFFPTQAALLGFGIPGRSMDVRLIRPRDGVPLHERDGYLYAGDEPALLLPDHRKPPPLDRRWQTGRLLRESLVDFRAPLGDILWLGAPENMATRRELLPKLSSQSAATLSPDPAAWFRVHGFLLAPPPGPHAFVIIDFDLHDLERGVPPHVLLMKWQFLLQRLQAQTSHTDGLLLGPVLDAVDRGRYASLPEDLRSLARAHGLRFIDRSHEQSLWTDRLLHQLRKEYRLP